LGFRGAVVKRQSTIFFFFFLSFMLLEATIGSNQVFFMQYKAFSTQKLAAIRSHFNVGNSYYYCKSITCHKGRAARGSENRSNYIKVH
jgi:hypothetical protein